MTKPNSRLDVETVQLHNWTPALKLYKSLKIPRQYDFVTRLPLNGAKYFTLLSERSIGKTTSIILFAMCAYETMGIIGQYVRSKQDMILNKNINELFKTIREYDYISKITGGKWNDVYYHARKWSYCKRDENGDIVEKSNLHFMFCLSTDRNEDYKSVYNAPTGDIIIYDEFIGKYYRQNEFCDFCDLTSTIMRHRTTPIIFMLANTIDPQSEYFNEMEIYDTVSLMEIGQHEIVRTSKGTNIYIELLSRDKNERDKKSFFNSLFFGFKNPRLNAITGENWAFDYYPHPKRGYTSVYPNVYLEYNNKLVNLEIVKYDNVGFWIIAHSATSTYDDSIIYTRDEIIDRRYRYKFGKGDNLDKFVWKLIDTKRVSYSNNMIGSIVRHYMTLKAS